MLYRTEAARRLSYKLIMIDFVARKVYLRTFTYAAYIELNVRTKYWCIEADQLFLLQKINEYQTN